MIESHLFLAFASQLFSGKDRVSTYFREGQTLFMTIYIINRHLTEMTFKKFLIFV